MTCYYPECTGGQSGTVCRPDCALINHTGTDKKMSKYNATTGECDFGIALDVLKRGHRVRRKDWGDAYVVIKDKGFFMWMPHRDRDVAWVPTWEEMLATDWLEVV